MLRVPAGEVANTVTNGITLLLSLAGAPLLISRVWEVGDFWCITGCSIFAAALIAVYTVSTLSHAVASPLPRRWFRILDQGLIYILIVGTYTPFALVYLRTPAWWAFFALMWTIALAGLISKLVLAHRIDSVTIWSYVLLGWLSVIPLVALVGVLPSAALGWVVAGGLSYTLGTLFFLRDDPRYHCHAIWHTLALGGSACHFVAIYQFVAGGSLAMLG
jgi:hemolysin III